MRRYTAFEHALEREMRRRRTRGAARFITLVITVVVVALCCTGLALIGRFW